MPNENNVIAELTADPREVADKRDQLAALEETCSFERLGKLGGQVREAKKTAPTRPNPGVPDSPTTVLEEGVGPVDRSRNRLTLAGRGQ